jgi:hypothetical protein
MDDGDGFIERESGGLIARHYLSVSISLPRIGILEADCETVEQHVDRHDVYPN